MNQKIRIVFLYILLILFSCSTKEEETFNLIEGIWVIEKAVYNNQDITNEFYVNTFVFEKGKSYNFLVIPRTETYDSENAIINITTKNASSYIEIESLNKIINGRYKITFLKDLLTNLTVFELKSRTTFIKLNKLPTVSERIF